MQIRTIDKGRYHRRELVLDEQAVAWLNVIDYQMRIGSAQVSMAGIGGVHTHHKHRMKGHMRVLFEDSLTYMREQGYDVSMLFGIPNFYNKFGYAVCLPSHKFVVQTRDAEDAQQDADAYTVRSIEPEDMPAVLELYNENAAQRTCSVLRSVEHFQAFTKGSRYDKKSDHFWLADRQGQLAAYAVFDKSTTEINVIEAEARNDRTFPILLHQFAEMAIDRRCGHISFFLPRDHPFAEYISRFGCDQTTQRHRFGGGMMRILNQHTLFTKIEPELVRRVSACEKVLCGAIALHTELGTITLPFENARCTVQDGGQAETSLTLSQDKLMQLIAGHRSARDVLNEADVTTGGDVLPWLNTLFPIGFPYIWRADHF